MQKCPHFKGVVRGIPVYIASIVAVSDPPWEEWSQGDGSGYGSVGIHLTLSSYSKS